MNKITSVDHALEVLGLTINFGLFPAAYKALGIPVKDIEPMIAGYKIEKIIEANNKVNNNWAPDWSDSNQWKYCVYQYVSKDAAKPAGFGFSYTHYDNWLSYTYVGSRLLVGTRDEALYIGKDFKELFETAWLIIPPAAEE